MERSRRRKTFALPAILLLALALGGSVSAGAPDERVSEAVLVVREMRSQSDVEAMADLLKQARGVAVFPSVVKMGLLLGGRHGDGLVLRRDPATGEWFGPNFIEMTGASFGLQIGVQSTALLLVVVNERGMKAFEGGKFTLGGDVSVAVGPVGRHAEAGTDAALEASVYSYSINRGLFAGVSLEGAAIDSDEAANQVYWGSALSPDRILRRRAGPKVRTLVQELEQLIALGK